MNDPTAPGTYDIFHAGMILAVSPFAPVVASSVGESIATLGERVTGRKSKAQTPCWFGSKCSALNNPKGNKCKWLHAKEELDEAAKARLEGTGRPSAQPEKDSKPLAGPGGSDKSAGAGKPLSTLAASPFKDRALALCDAACPVGKFVRHEGEATEQLWEPFGGQPVAVLGAYQSREEGG